MATAGASAEAVEYQYDVDNEFFALWLDRTMSYSCALWDGDDGLDLEAAQRNKIGYHIAQARAEGAGRVLDVGCGWGGVLRSLVTEHGVGEAVGLTLSRNQHAWVTAMGLPGVEVHLGSWEAHEPDERYNSVISLGAFEHFARPDLPRVEKQRAYGEFFRACHGWLVDDGCLSLQTMALEAADERFLRAMEIYGDRFIPQSTAPYFEEIVDAAAPWFEVRAVRSDGDQYARTMALWLGGLNAARREVIDRYGPGLHKRFRQTLRGAQTMFEERRLTLYRITFQRRPTPGPRAWLHG